MENLLLNKKVGSDFYDRIEKIKNDSETYLFAVIGDLDINAEYGETALIVSTERIICVDTKKETAKAYAISEIKEIRTKRMYSNAYIEIEKADGEKEIIYRYTYAITELMDMTASYIRAIISNKDSAEALDRVKDKYEKLVKVCPKCGRQLLHAGAPCIKCQSKTKVFSKLFKYVKPEVGKIIATLLLTIVMIVIELLPPYTSKLIIDNILPNKDTGMLTWIVVVMFFAYVLHYGIAAWIGYLLCKAGAGIVIRLRKDVYEKAQHLPMNFYDKTPTGHVINRIGNDSSTIQNFIISMCREILKQVLLLFGIVIAMLLMNWRLTLISLIPVPFVVWIGNIFARVVRPYYRRIWRKWAGVTSVLTDSIPCIRIVKAFSGEERAAQKFAEKNEEWKVTHIQAGKIGNLFPNIIGFLVTIGSLAIWALGGRWVIDGTGGLTGGILVSFISYTSMFYVPISFFASISNTYQDTLASIERIMDVLDAEPELNKEDAIKVDEMEGEIEFKNVSFSFDKTKKVLSGISFKVKKGEVCGIVGTTGSGKTTITNLLLRYYSNYSGEILVDGKELRDLDVESYRNHIGYVQQEPMMFSDTIFNNISYGAPDKTVEEVMQAADVANASRFILSQPDAYDSMLGERGIGLSGGEKQRISIARAILKNPEILIFDEATAAVDSETEELIQQAIDELVKGRTTFMIAHRLSTLRKADRILVVENGEIIENGSHEELLAKKGKYYKLVNIQSMKKDRIELE